MRKKRDERTQGAPKIHPLGNQNQNILALMVSATRRKRTNGKRIYIGFASSRESAHAEEEGYTTDAKNAHGAKKHHRSLKQDPP